jgi:signal transduction histidine kinase
MRALDLGLDADPFERALLKYATHRAGLAFREAHLLIADPTTGLLHGWGWAATGDSDALDEALDLARPSPPDPDAQERVARLRRRQFDVAQLDACVRDAWESGQSRAGVADAAGTPWTFGEDLVVAPLRRGNVPYGILICAGLPAGAQVEAALAGLEHAVSIVSVALGIQHRLAAERQRAQRAAAVAEMAHAGLSAMNVAEALHLCARLAARASGARGSAVWRAHGDALRLEVTHGSAGQRERVARALMFPARESVMGLGSRIVAGSEEPHVPDGPPVPPAALVPLIAYGRPLGVLGVWDRAVRSPAEAAGFDAPDMEFLHTIADLLAMVLDQAERFDALRASEQERDELRRRVRREERLAAVGEMASRAAREVRNPIASVAAFARRAHREMRPDDPLREYIEIVMQEIDRIDRIVGTQVAMSDPAPPRLRMENVNTIVQRALQQAGEALVRRRIRLLKKLAADLPELLLDPERFQRVTGNIMMNALDAVPLGGRMRIETRRSGGFVVIEVAHDGPHDPGTMMEELFAPFVADREGRGMGLGVARQVIREHGGEIRVRSDTEWGTVLTLTLPIVENDDRRRAAAERRHLRGDRRRRSPGPA